MVHLFRRRPDDTQDPFDQAGDPDFDGVIAALREHLPRVTSRCRGSLNGGYEHEFASYAKIGEWVSLPQPLRDIYQRDGKTGPIVFVWSRTTTRPAEGRPILTLRNTHVMR